MCPDTDFGDLVQILSHVLLIEMFGWMVVVAVVVIVAVVVAVVVVAVVVVAVVVVAVVVGVVVVVVDGCKYGNLIVVCDLPVSVVTAFRSRY